MKTDAVLLTTPTFPYPTLPPNESLTDAMGQRFTHADDLFTLNSHTHCYANHILAQNIKKPAVLLEYPRWDDFCKEVRKEYEVIGISAFPVHLDTVMKMCDHIRKVSPKTKILLGSYAAQAFAATYDEVTRKKYVDEVVLGEGVSFFRKFLGEDDVERPIEQRLMPKCGAGPIFITRYPCGNIGFMVSGLGCPGGCDFCSTTAMFGFKRKMMLSPKDLVRHIKDYYDHFPDVRQAFIIEEDHFRHHDYLFEMRDYWLKNPELMERMDWFGFGSVDNIASFAEKYGWDTIGELGIGAIFIGVESKFAGRHGYDKREGSDAREVFHKLHQMGIRTIGAWICGWDFHDHTNMYEDLNYFIACYPTFEQLTRMSPFPGTKLYDKLMEEGRVKNVPWEDVHFWSGAQDNINLESHETLNLTEEGYALIYRTWGPSLLRRLDVTLNGYEYWMNASNPLMKEHKTILFKQQAALTMCVISAMYRFAPNGVVRRRVRKSEERYKSLIGEPTFIMKVVDKATRFAAVRWKKKDAYDPFNQYPKEEPFKKYTYNKNNTNGATPYKTEYPNMGSLKVRSGLFREYLTYKISGNVIQLLRYLPNVEKDPVIDTFIQKSVLNRTFFGF